MKRIVHYLIKSIVVVLAIIGFFTVTVAASRPWRNILTPLSDGVSVCIQPVFGNSDAGARLVKGYQARVAGCVMSTSSKDPPDCTDVLLQVPPAQNPKAKAIVVWGLTQAALERELTVSTEGLP